MENLLYISFAFSLSYFFYIVFISFDVEEYIYIYCAQLMTNSNPVGTIQTEFQFLVMQPHNLTRCRGSKLNLTL